MSKSLRLSEKWFRFGLWIVAFVFAGFLIGLGGTVVHNLPKVEQHLMLEDFIDKHQAEKARAEIRQTEEAQRVAQEALGQAELKHNVARANSATASDAFNSWVATRTATQRAEQDPDLIARTRALEDQRAAERKALSEVERQQQAALDARQSAARAQRELSELQRAAGDAYASAQRSQELRVFLYRLALTLPLLGIAGWLFAKKRQSTWWPFVWGFIYFALFAFFVELVPYLPSYGGYVRYVVGIVVTALVGRYAILALNRYLEKQKLAEALPDVERRKDLSYDTALARLAKKVCPGCERAVDLTDTSIDFCPHCGICLYDHCAKCQGRKSAFARFCHVCGTAASQGRA